MSTTTQDGQARDEGTISRVRMWIAIGASAVTIGGGAVALAGAHGDLVHRLEVLEERISSDTQMRADIADIKAELGLVRRFFRIPDVVPEVKP